MFYFSQKNWEYQVGLEIDFKKKRKMKTKPKTSKNLPLGKEHNYMEINVTFKSQ